MSDQSPVPSDLYSRTLRSIKDNPSSLGSSSTVHAHDFYGNAETWVIDTFNVDGRVTVFIQFNAAEGGRRFVLPPEVTGRIFSHNESLITRVRRRAARKAVDTKRERNIAPVPRKTHD